MTNKVAVQPEEIEHWLGIPAGDTLRVPTFRLSTAASHGLLILLGVGLMLLAYSPAHWLVLVAALLVLIFTVCTAIGNAQPGWILASADGLWKSDGARGTPIPWDRVERMERRADVPRMRRAARTGWEFYQTDDPVGRVWYWEVEAADEIFRFRDEGEPERRLAATLRRVLAARESGRRLPADPWEGVPAGAVSLSVGAPEPKADRGLSRADP